MFAPLSKSHGLSSALKIEDETFVGKKQGIVSILWSDSDRPTKVSSLRRTLSADMSSKKWLSQNGFSPMKKIASSEEFPISITDSSEEEEEYGEKNEMKKEQEKPGQLDIWTLIISQKAQEDNSKSPPPPYIHPLVKRSASSLSGKSLEICTESLGSETGSDGFSSYPPSETGDVEEEQEYSKAGQNFSFEAEEPRNLKYNYVNGGRKSGQQRSLPPPIPSLSLHDGASVRMKTHRHNGRLVVEAVSVPSQNNFRAQRHDGRLVLTFANKSNTTLDETDSKNEEMDHEEEKRVEDMDLEFYSFENEEEEGETEDEDEETEKSNDYKNFVTKLPALLNYKPIGFANRNPTWPKRFNEMVKLVDQVEDDEKAETVTPPLAQSLPPRPRTARKIRVPPSAAVPAASYNAYEYYWRPKPMDKGAGVKCIEQTQRDLKNNQNKLVLSKNPVANEQQELVVLRGQMGDYLVPLLKSCKEPRRSLMFSEPHCIATS